MSDQERVSFGKSADYLAREESYATRKQAADAALKGYNYPPLSQKFSDAIRLMSRLTTDAVETMAHEITDAVAKSKSEPKKLLTLGPDIAAKIAENNARGMWNYLATHTKPARKADTFIKEVEHTVKTFYNKIKGAEGMKELDISYSKLLELEAEGVLELLGINMVNKDIRELMENLPDLRGEHFYLIRGIVAPPESMLLLKKFLEDCGADVTIEKVPPKGWPKWMPYNANTGNSRTKTAHMGKEIGDIYEKTGKPVTIVGWSHGGMSSFLGANEAPQGAVKNIVTIVGVVNPNYPTVPIKAHSYLNDNFEAAHGRTSYLPHDVDNILEMMRDFPAKNPDINFVFIGSTRDGLVKYEAATRKEDEHLPNVTNIKIGTGHVFAPFDNRVKAAIANSAVGNQISQRPDGTLHVTRPNDEGPEVSAPHLNGS